jgi:23S rRNA (cytosine1962-C5)-methyltransferase
MQQVTVSYRAAKRVQQGHPWVFRSDLEADASLAPGSAVRVHLPSGKPLGVAHYSSTSQIALRMLGSREVAVDAAFLHERIAAAIATRRRLVHDADAYRLVYGEADFLPGLVVDTYGGCLAIQTLNQGMDALQPTIVEVLQELLLPQAIVEKNSASVRTLEGLALRNGLLHGELPPNHIITLNGLRFGVNLLTGQKTGFFLDQRENYAAVRRYARGKALDCFSYAGGFALHMASVCDHVEGIDASADAVSLAHRNAIENGIGNVDFREADVFHLLAGYQAARRSYQSIVLDPPAFTKSRAKREDAARGYKEINIRAMRLLEPGGTLVSCSCSHHVSPEALLEVLREASVECGRPLRLLEARTQAGCHPILLGVPETQYLKCFVLQVL